jgi:hypothetical protein
MVVGCATGPQRKNVNLEDSHILTLLEIFEGMTSKCESICLMFSSFLSTPGGICR